MARTKRKEETPEQRKRRLAYHREWMKRYRKAHPEKTREVNARYLAAHADKKRECDRKRYAAKREVIIAQVCRYAKNNRDKINAQRRAREERDPERAVEMRRASYIRGRERQKSRRAEKKDALAAYMRHKRQSDPAFIVADRLRRRINCALTNRGAAKSGRLIDVSGCTVSALVRHIERQFLPGMSWKNRAEWHIDHIVPCSAFDLADPQQQRVAFHYSNLRPSWALDNRRKHAKIPGGQRRLFWTHKDVRQISRRLRQTR